MADERQGPDRTLASLETRGFVGRIWPTLLAATAAGLILMSAIQVAGGPILLAMAGLFAGILAVLGFRTGDMRYRLTEEGIERTFRPLLARTLGLAARRQSFRFDEIRSYQRDRDWSRYRAVEVESLRLRVSRWPYRVLIHDMMGRDAFAAFADRFEALAGGEAAQIERRPGFYGTIWAKLLTVFFAAVAAVLLVLFVLGQLSPTGIFRLLIVILPGVIYMAYRVFFRRAEPGPATKGARADG